MPPRSNRSGERLTAVDIVQLETQLREADDPNTVAIPSGYQVAVNEEEAQRCVLPPGLSLGDALEVALEALEDVCFGSVGIHILQPVSVHVTELKVVLAGGSKPSRQPRAGGSATVPRERSVVRPGPAKTARMAPSGSPQRAKSKSPPRAQTERKALVPKAAVVRPPIKTKPRKHLPEPPASTNPMRADVQKYKAEVARLKKEQERLEKMQARRAANKEALDEWKAKRAAKEAERQQEREQAEAAKEAEEDKKREKDRQRQERNRKKLEAYRERQRLDAERAADGDFGNSGVAPSEPANSASQPPPPQKATKSAGSPKKEEASRKKPAIDAKPAAGSEGNAVDAEGFVSGQEGMAEPASDAPPSPPAAEEAPVPEAEPTPAEPEGAGPAIATEQSGAPTAAAN